MSILVVGNATVDISYEIKRLPSTGETLLASGRMVDAGGKGLNQAIAAKKDETMSDEEFKNSLPFHIKNYIKVATKLCFESKISGHLSVFAPHFVAIKKCCPAELCMLLL